MKETWNYALMDLLKKARLGDTNELNEFLKKYADLTAVNEEYSLLLLFRHFEVQHGNGVRSVLNSHPADENFQCGITIVRCTDEMSSQANVYIPNNLNYKALKITGPEIEIITGKKSVTTNVPELLRK